MNKTTNQFIWNVLRGAGILPLTLLTSLLALLSPVAKADTAVTIANPISKIFAGAGLTGVYPGYTNSQVTFTLAGDTNLVNLYVNVVGNPAGVTAGFVTSGSNPNSAANINALLATTNSMSVYLSVSVVSAPKGTYQLELIASNTFNGFSVTNASTLLVMPDVFSAQVGSADTNWSSDANWSVGTKPVAGNSARFQYSGATPQTNTYSDTSIVLDSLLFSPRADNMTVTNFFAPNVTLAVSGSNGFYAGADVRASTGTDGRLNLWMIGDTGSLVVTNSQAVFSLFENIADGGGSKGTISLGGLGNLYVDVNIAGIGSAFSALPNTTPGASQGVYELAKTNFIRATYVGDYSGLGGMTNSIMFLNHGWVGNGNFASVVNLGASNVFYADSVSAITHQSGSASSVLRFNPAYSNLNNTVAIFRGTNGGRMSFFGVGVDSGLTTGTTRTRGAGADFRGGRVDMLVDTIWLGHNKTNFNSSNGQIGNLLFDKGLINVNTLIAGYKQWTNLNSVQSTITVGGATTFGGNATNAVLSINNLLDLGHADAPAFELINTPTGFGKLVINTNGVVRANTIIAGAVTTGNSITINGGGSLVVTNAIGTAAIPLPTLSVQNKGHLVLNVTAGVTSCFVTNLTDVAGAILDVATMTGFSPTVPATNVLISYITAGSHNIAIGNYPSGYNNISLFDNTVAKQIELRVQTNAPAVLRWKGYVNNVWDHNTANWQDTNTLQQVRWVDSDFAIFDDSGVVPKSVSVSEEIIVNSAGTGIYMTNSTSAYSFENGGGQIDTCSMIKDGTAALTNNGVSFVNATINGGRLLGTGSFGNVTVSAGSVLDYNGIVNGPLVVNGLALFNSSAIANGAVTLSGTAVMTNFGIIQGGSLAVNGTSLLVNQAGGLLKSIGSSGSVNVAAGATLINFGDIGVDAIFNPPGQANTLTVNGTFKDMGVGNIFLTTATFNSGSTFLPGGDGIGTTQIKSASVGSSFPGRLTMQTGSTNIIKVDFSNPQTNTVVVAQFTDFGGNTSVKAFDGCTVVMNNINVGAGLFANGQSFRVFTGPGGGDIGNEGLNTTNRYPIVTPIIPVLNTKWDLTNLRDTSPNGILNISGFPTTGTNLTFSTFKDGGNVVTHLQWPSEYIGWKLQQQTNALSIGLYTNWTTVAGSPATNDLYITNDAAIPASFFRMSYP